MLLSLAEAYVVDDLCADVCVQAGNELLPAHAQLSAQDRHGEPDDKRLVANVHTGGVAGNGFTRNERPGINQTLLQQGSLKALGPEVVHDNVADCLFSPFKHA